MKLLRNNHTSMTPLNERLRRTRVDKQHEFYAGVERRYMENTLAASGIKGTVYLYLKQGIRCTCSQQSSLLNANGELETTSVERVIQGVYGPTTRVAFDANDLDFNEEVDNPDFPQDVEPTEFDLVDLTGFDTARCACCFGSGYVGGFELTNGFRLVLDTQAEHDTDHTLITSENPNAFSGGTYCDWPCELSAFPGQRLAGIRLWNKDVLISESDYSYTLPAFGIPGTFHVETNQTFTHAEIQLSFGPLDIDITQVDSVLYPELNGTNGTPQVYLPPNVPITKFSVIRDWKYGRAWQVTNVQMHYNNHGKAVFWQCDCRLVQQHELLNLLLK